MAGGDDGSTLTFLVIFVCCIISCTLGLVIWANGGALPGGLTAADIAKALAGVKFSRAVQPDIIQSSTSHGAFNYNHILNSVTVSGSDLGTIVTGKTQDDCDALCHSTTNCFGYTIDGSNCQLKKSVTIIQFKPGASNLYASQDIGGVLYQYFPYTKVNDGLYPPLWTFTGSFADAVSNCHTNKDVCNGFTWDGNQTAVMYGTILAVQGPVQTGQAGVYTTLDKQPQYALVPNQKFGDAPTTPPSPVQVCPQWSNAPIPGSTTDVTQYFTNASGPSGQCTNWVSSGWDAGPDAAAQKADGPSYQSGLGSTARSNTITVTDLTNCMNACYNNTWCQSFVFDNNVKSCYMRRDQAAWPAVKLDRPTQQVCRPAGYQPTDLTQPTVVCDCGVIGSAGGLGGSCNTNTIGKNSGQNDSNKVSYVRKNPPLPEFCPQQCSNDPNCVVAWYDTSNGQCNLYEFMPTQPQANQATSNTVWMINNFPG